MRGPYVECMIILENPSPSLVDTNAIIMDIPCVVRYMRWNQYPKSDDSDVYQERKCARTTNRVQMQRPKPVCSSAHMLICPLVVSLRCVCMSSLRVFYVCGLHVELCVGCCECCDLLGCYLASVDVEVFQLAACGEWHDVRYVRAPF